MGTLNSRIEKLEQQANRYLDVRDMTDNELLDVCGLPHDSTIEQVQAIINEGAHHGE